MYKYRVYTFVLCKPYWCCFWGDMLIAADWLLDPLGKLLETPNSRDQTLSLGLGNTKPCLTPCQHNTESQTPLITNPISFLESRSIVLLN